MTWAGGREGEAGYFLLPSLLSPTPLRRFHLLILCPTRQHVAIIFLDNFALNVYSLSISVPKFTTKGNLIKWPPSLSAGLLSRK